MTDPAFVGAFVTRIISFKTHDLRFPTSKFLDGSDAMNPDPDYSAAYVILQTDHPQSLAGHGFTFTIGRGNELCIAAIEAFRPLVEGRTLEEIVKDMGHFWRSLAGDSQLRWVGPEKGVIHLALAAVINAIWDLWAKSVGKPVWKLVADLTPEQIVSLIDFRHIQDVLTPNQALEILRAQAPGRAEREARLRAEGYPAYTTSAGWLGYDDEKVRRLCREGLAKGWEAFKIKVGRNLEEDIRRCGIVREVIGPQRRMMIDANQVWEVDEAIEWVRALAKFNPWWIEEPLSPDDILGHGKVARAVRPIRVATGEHAHNRIMFKQFRRATRSMWRSRTPAGSEDSMKPLRFPCSPRSSASPSARTPAALDSANTPNISR
jgi:L-fuconate dehydratase